MALPGKHYLAFDLGAESGRAIVGALNDNKLSLDVLHRFATGPVQLHNTIYWDFPGIIRELRSGLAIFSQKYGRELAGIGVDSWGVDFGLLDRDGNLLSNPVHYRDSRTNGVPEQVFKKISKRELYNHTGIQYMQINTIFQLASLVMNKSPLLDVAHKMLPIADLISYFLCGEQTAEYTLASTSQLLAVRTGSWDLELMQSLDLPTDLLPEIIAPASVVGTLLENWSSTAGVRADIPVIAPACHDTAAAVAAIPASIPDWAYISSGTWSLLGLELPEPVVTDAAFRADFTNEGGVDSTYRFLKNIMGLWLVQECRRTWARTGQNYDYAQLVKMAEEAQPFRTIVQPADSRFLSPGDMPARIIAYAQETGQPVPETPGQFVRCSLESLALCYRHNIKLLQDITGRQIRVLHIVGGGCQNNLLNQFAADATQLRVLAGPVEATALGNILLQATACGDIGSISEAREIVRNSVQIVEFTPTADRDDWDEAYERFSSLPATK